MSYQGFQAISVNHQRLCQPIYQLANEILSPRFLSYARAKSDSVNTLLKLQNAVKGFAIKKQTIAAWEWNSNLVYQVPRSGGREAVCRKKALRMAV